MCFHLQYCNESRCKEVLLFGVGYLPSHTLAEKVLLGNTLIWNPSSHWSTHCPLDVTKSTHLYNNDDGKHKLQLCVNDACMYFRRNSHTSYMDPHVSSHNRRTHWRKQSNQGWDLWKIQKPRAPLATSIVHQPSDHVASTLIRAKAPSVLMCQLGFSAP